MTAAMGNEGLSEIAAASITSSYATVATLSFNAEQLIFNNTLDGETLLSIDGGATTFLRLAPGVSFVLNLSPERFIPRGSLIQVKTGSGSSTTGKLGVTPLYRK